MNGHESLHSDIIPTVVVAMTMLSEDYSKFILLENNRKIEFHVQVSGCGLRVNNTSLTAWSLLLHTYSNLWS